VGRWLICDFRVSLLVPSAVDASSTFSFLLI
jgi:hypothetical protein